MDVLDVQEESSTGNGFLPIALALIGIVLGGVALYFAFSFQQVQPVDYDPVILEERIEMLQLKLDALTAENELLKSGLSRVVQQTQTALTQVSKEMSAMSQQHAQSRQAFSKLATAPQQTPTATASASKPKPDTLKVNQSQYVVQAGDTLAKIARRYGISLQALLEANPNTNPKALKIGQIIYLPAAHE